MRALVHTLLVATLALHAGGWAEAQQPRATGSRPGWLVAAKFLRSAPIDARRALCSEPGSRPGLCGLGEVLLQGKVPRELLLRVVSNAHARPYLVQSLRALPHVQDVEGVAGTLDRLASGRNDGNVRGAAFELVAGACLRGRLKALGVTIDGNETDGVLRDGTVVEMKNRHKDFIGKVEHQLALRCKGAAPAMLVVPHELTSAQLDSLRRRGSELGRRFSVVVADPVTLTAHEILSVQPAAAH